MKRTSFIISLAILALVFAVCIFGLRSADEASGDEAVRVLEDSIRRAAVSCYSIEGRYPDTIEYITDNYGVYVDEDRFMVHYEAFASNIMPDVTVIER